jgi:hypothetical protein
MNTITNNKTATKSQGAADQRSCWLCNDATHLATRCENRCRNARCAAQRLRTHSWAECPYKTQPFCQLCGETGHGVSARECIHRCFAHDKWLHVVSECPTRCGDCGDRGHMARSSVCSLKRDRRPMSLLDVAAFKVLVPAAAPQVEEPKKAAATIAAPAAKQQQSTRQKGVEMKRKEEEKAKKEEQMRQALAVLEKEKERILKELAQLQSEESTATTKKQKAPGLRGEVGRKTLKQSRG